MIPPEKSEMDLQAAIHQLDQIQNSLERSECFRGYRSQSVAFSGLLGLAGVLLQTWLIPDPAASLQTWLGLWIGIAVVCVVVVAVEILVRCWRIRSRREFQLTKTALRQLVPALFAGAILTHIISSTAPESAWMLPGLWSVLFGLGVFSSLPQMPDRFVWVACWYVGGGLWLLMIGRGEAALAPWMMLIFVIGQMLSALQLYLTLERPHV